MANAKEIQDRMKSINDTLKITNAMYMISSSKLKKDAMELALKSDSLSRALKQNEAYIQSIQKVLTGDLEYAKFSKDSIFSEIDEAPSKADLSTSKEELELREQVAKEEKKPGLVAPKRKK